MRTDIHAIVQRLMQRLMLAGVPMMVAACSDGGAISGMGGAGSGGKAGGGGAGGGQACSPLAVECGPVPLCGNPANPVEPGSPLPLTVTTAAFDPDDPRWGDLYRACLADEGGVGCGPNCKGLCIAATQSAGGASYIQYVKCDIGCGPPAQITTSYTNAVCGRRPALGFGRRCIDHREPALGRWLAEAAELEAASVPAFRHLVEQLRAHDAPRSLVGEARTAMVDEARHWRRTRDVARHHGGRPVRRAIPKTPPCSLEQLALANVVEGCVRETYGALIAMRQAGAARDPHIRGLMSEIAEDEATHAALAWRIDAWASAQLSAPYQQRRRRAARAAVRELLAGSVLAIDESTRAAAGMPTAAEANDILGATYAQLWQPSLGA